METGIKLVSLKGAPCVLVFDEITDTPLDEPSELVEVVGQRGLHLLARAEIIRAAKKSHPGLPVYGLWQTVLEAKDVDFSAYEVITFEPEGGEEAGSYCSFRKGIPVSADVFFLDLPASVNARKRLRITAKTLESLPPPKTPILLREEVAAIRRKRDRISGILGGSICVLVVVCSVAANFFLQARSDRFQAEADAINSQVRIVAAENGELMRNADPRTAQSKLRTRAVITRFIELLSRLDGAKLDSLPFEGVTSATIGVTKLPTDLSFETLATISPTAPLNITFNLDGSGPPGQ